MYVCGKVVVWLDISCKGCVSRYRVEGELRGLAAQHISNLNTPNAWG
jgi:hypothetical protein